MFDVQKPRKRCLFSLNLIDLKPFQDIIFNLGLREFAFSNKNPNREVWEIIEYWSRKIHRVRIKFCRERVKSSILYQYGCEKSMSDFIWKYSTRASLENICVKGWLRLYLMKCQIIGPVACVKKRNYRDNENQNLAECRLIRMTHILSLYKKIFNKHYTFLMWRDSTKTEKQHSGHGGCHQNFLLRYPSISNNKRFLENNQKF